MTFNGKNQSGEARTIALQYTGNDNVYTSYDYKRDTVQSFRTRILSLPQRVPESVHLGLFRQNHGSKIVQGRKELVFDLDITDFSRYCLCGHIKKLCPVCWVQMQGASLILEHLLEHTLGYRQANRLWIFSGNKGLHCFINALSAMVLCDKEREQLYKRLFIGTDDDTRLASFVNTCCTKYPEFVKCIEHFFITHMIREQDIFSLPRFLIREDPPIEESFEIFCIRHLRIHHGPLAQIVRGTWEGISGCIKKECNDDDPLSKKPRLIEHNISVRKWRALQQLEELRRDTTSYKPSVFIMFRLLYPMIDAGPLKIGHQIKLPFSVHHSTKNIALPLTHESIMKMDIKKDILPLHLLCQAVLTQKKSIPTCFSVGKELLEQWINAYPL